MKNWQILIGLLAIAIAILISGFLIAQAIEGAGTNILHGLSTL